MVKKKKLNKKVKRTSKKCICNKCKCGRMPSNKSKTSKVKKLIRLAKLRKKKRK